MSAKDGMLTSFVTDEKENIIAPSLSENEEYEETEAPVDKEFKNGTLCDHVDGANPTNVSEPKDRRINAKGTANHGEQSMLTFAPPMEYESRDNVSPTPDTPGSGANSQTASPIAEDKDPNPLKEQDSEMLGCSIDEKGPSSTIDIASDLDGKNGKTSSLTQDSKAASCSFENGDGTASPQDASADPNENKSSSPVGFCAQGSTDERNFQPNRCCVVCGCELTLLMPVCCCQQYAYRCTSPHTTLSSPDSLSSTDATSI